MTGVFWTMAASANNCSVDGVPLECNFWQDQSEVSSSLSSSSIVFGNR
jgi:hypothetical protein